MRNSALFSGPCFTCSPNISQNRAPARRLALKLGAALIALAGASLFGSPAHADDAASCKGVDPYENYACLDAYLGDDVFTRLINYYKLEMGHGAPPADPNGPPSRRDYWPGTPQTSPPMPFTEWPHGGVTPIGVTLPNSVDAPLMVAIANTKVGQWLSDNHLQIYGWVDPGFNASTNSVKPGGNYPMAYAYTPNQLQLDQAVIYLDRFPDTVQTDHLDWGMRLSAIYGENYRYTTAYGVTSWQLLKKNQVNGYDFPMMYGEVYIPWVAEGMIIRAGRFIAVPDTEAQLAPNNYMYTHSITYTFDNYTITGVMASVAATKNWLLQAGITVGTEAPPWHINTSNKIANLYPNRLFPDNTFAKDPGSQPSAVACIRWESDSGDDAVYPCLDGWNSGTWGYNNLQWKGFTYYHKFDDKWHMTFEFYDEDQRNVLNQNNPAAMTIFNNGGTPFSPQYMPYNSPFLAQCKSTTKLACTANEMGAVSYINYSWNPLDNLSMRVEFYNDQQGQRTGTKARYTDIGFGWQHWLSPQFEFRPEIVYYRSIGGNAFNGNFNAGIPNDRDYTFEFSADAILHF
jgi:hypothetical protein